MSDKKKVVEVVAFRLGAVMQEEVRDIRNLKPARGEHLMARRTRKEKLDAHEDREKTAVRKRDRYQCRWPKCIYRNQAVPLEVAHLEHKGPGGNPDGTRSVRSKMILLCQNHHQGRTSLHSKDLRIVPLTEQGTDGPCKFEFSMGSLGWVTEFVETAPRVAKRARVSR